MYAVVHPGELLGIERRGVATIPASGRKPRSARHGQHLAVVAGRPAEERQVVHERLGEETLLAERARRSSSRGASTAAAGRDPSTCGTCAYAGEVPPSASITLAFRGAAREQIVAADDVRDSISMSSTATASRKTGEPSERTRTKSRSSPGAPVGPRPSPGRPRPTRARASGSGPRTCGPRRRRRRFGVGRACGTGRRSPAARLGRARPSCARRAPLGAVAAGRRAAREELGRPFSA